MGMNTIIILVLIAGAAFFVWQQVSKRKNAADSVTPTVPNPPVFTPSPQPVPVESNELQGSYPTDTALREFIVRTQYNGAVVLDDVQIHGGFGPAAQFTTQIDGSVRR